jgi:hypothetical protein
LHHVGRGYLRGEPPFGSHPETGVRYLVRAADAGCVDALNSIAETLSLQELVRYQLLPQLHQGAARGLHVAEYKLGLWLSTEIEGRPLGQFWLRRAAAGGLAEARLALAEALAQEALPAAMCDAIRLLRAECLAGNVRAWAPLAQAALDAGDLALFRGSLQRACETDCGGKGALPALIVEALVLERRRDVPALDCPAPLIRAALMQQTDAGDARAMLLLGKALCGLDEALRRRADLASGRGLRHGLMLLTFAANAGEVDAWLALASLYGSRRRLPFATASHRYCLERAAAMGSAVASVQLGQLLLDTARTGQDLQHAMELLWPAAQQGNAAVRALLGNLVLPVAGDLEAARSAVALVSARNELLAARLWLGRTFGLTRHEALTLDVRRAIRSWGLWVDTSGFFTQRRKATPRVVPVTSSDAAAALQRGTRLFENVNASALGPEGNYRSRVYTMRAVFNRLKLSETLFFAEVERVNVGTPRRTATRQLHSLQ